MCIKLTTHQEVEVLIAPRAHFPVAGVTETTLPLTQTNLGISFSTDFINEALLNIVDLDSRVFAINPGALFNCVKEEIELKLGRF